MNEIGRRCWHCDRDVSAQELSYASYLIPRSAAEGGPATLHRCSHCGADSVVERSVGGAVLLSPPHVLGVRSQGAPSAVKRRARVWEAEHRKDRIAFLTGTTPDPVALGDRKETAGPPPPPSERPTPPPPAPEEPRPPRARDSVREANSILQAYEILGLPLTATADQVKRIYRELVKGCHPDRVAGLDTEIREAAERKFQEVRGAYEMILGDE